MKTLSVFSFLRRILLHTNCPKVCFIFCTDSVKIDRALRALWKLRENSSFQLWSAQWAEEATRTQELLTAT